jgi:hypothetical protein
MILIAIVIYRLFPGITVENIVGRSFAGILIVNLFLNCLFYPELFTYQPGMTAAGYLEKNKIRGPIYTITYASPEFAFEFYSEKPVMQLQRSGLRSLKDPVLVFTGQPEIDSLRKDGLAVKEIQAFRHFHISRLTGSFISQRTRDKVVDSSVLAVIAP